MSVVALSGPNGMAPYLGAAIAFGAPVDIVAYVGTDPCRADWLSDAYLNKKFGQLYTNPKQGWWSTLAGVRGRIQVLVDKMTAAGNTMEIETAVQMWRDKSDKANEWAGLTAILVYKCTSSGGASTGASIFGGKGLLIGLAALAVAGGAYYFTRGK